MADGRSHTHARLAAGRTRASVAYLGSATLYFRIFLDKPPRESFHRRANTSELSEQRFAVVRLNGAVSVYAAQCVT